MSCRTCGRRVSERVAALYRGRCPLCHLRNPPPRHNSQAQALLPLPERRPVALVDEEAPQALPAAKGHTGRLF